MPGTQLADSFQAQEQHAMMGGLTFFVPESLLLKVEKRICSYEGSRKRIWRQFGGNGLEQLHLGVAGSNLAARRLYQSFDFEVVGVAPRALKLGEQYWDDVLMMLELR